MSERKEPERLHLFVRTMQQEGHLLRVSALSSEIQTASSLLLSSGGGAHLRQELRALCTACNGQAVIAGRTYSSEPCHFGI